MKPELLQDAMSLLPDDLIREADALRQRKKAPIPWKRYLPMAACFALVVAASLFAMTLLQPKGAAEESAMQAAEEPMLGYSGNSANEPAAAQTADTTAGSAAAKAEDAEDSIPEAPRADAAAGIVPYYWETPRRKNTTACYTSAPRVRLLSSPEELEDYLAHYAYQYDFGEIPKNSAEYDSDWFEAWDLLLMAVHSVPVGSACEVRSVTERNGVWEVCIAHDAFDPETGSECTDWHILLAVEKNRIPDKESVTVVFVHQEEEQ